MRGGKPNDDKCINTIIRTTHQRVALHRAHCFGCTGFAEGACASCPIEHLVDDAVTKAQRRIMEIRPRRGRHVPVVDW